MMKDRILAISLLAAVVFSACAAPAPVPVSTATATAAVDEDAQVGDLVETFGRRLQAVALLAPDAAEQIQTQYAGLVSPALLKIWMEDTSKAPGRMVSSPWPDRIEIATLVSETADRYVIDGFVVEITSAELASGGVADRIPVHMVVERQQGHWLITGYAEGR
jgi:hypothetical protein